MFVLLWSAFIAHSAQATSIYSPAGEKECWVASQVEVEPQNPTADIHIEGDRIKSSAPLVFLYKQKGSFAGAELEAIKSRLLALKPAFKFPGLDATQQQKYEFAFDYWNWISVDVLKGMQVRPNLLIVEDKSLFQPGPRETKGEYIKKIESNFGQCSAGDCYTAKVQLSPQLGPNYASDFGVGRPKELKLPAPISETQYAIYKNELISFKVTWRARLNEKYHPVITDKRTYSGC